MIRFADKLDYLMTLFKVSNSELAKGINVDPSLISRWKTGERSLARNSTHLPNIARFFIGIDSFDYQRDMLGRLISDHHPEFNLCDNNRKTYLFTSWLNSEAPSPSLGTGKTIIDQSPLAMAVCRNGVIMFANQAFARVFQCLSNNNPVGMTIQDFIEPVSRPTLTERLQPGDKGLLPSFSFETTGWRQDKVGFPLAGEISVVDLQDGPANVVYISDNSDLKNYEEKLKRQLGIQSLILSISTIFNHVALESIDDLIHEALARLGRFDDGDRCYVFLYSENDKTMSNTHEWCAHGIAPEIDGLQGIPVATTPWWHQSMLKCDYLYISDIQKLPPEAELEKELLTKQHIQSLLIVPLRVDGHLIGYVGIDSVRCQKIWNLDSIMMMQTISQIICRGINQKRHLQSLADSENFYQVLFNAGEIKMIIDPQFTVIDVNDSFAAMTGYAREDIKGLCWLDLLSAEARNQFVTGFNTLAEIRRATVKLKIPTRQRSVKVLNILLSIEKIAGTDRYIVIFIDLSEQSRVKRTLKSIHDCNSYILKASTEDGMLRQFCLNIVEKGGFEMAWVGHVMTDEERTLRPVAIAGRDNGYVDSLKIRLGDPIRGSGPAGTAIKENRTIVCKNIQTDPSYAPWVIKAAAMGFQAVINIPMSVSDKKPNALLVIYSSNPDAFDEIEVRLLTNMATSLTLGASALRSISEQQTRKSGTMRPPSRLKT